MNAAKNTRPISSFSNETSVSENFYFKYQKKLLQNSEKIQSESDENSMTMTQLETENTLKVAYENHGSKQLEVVLIILVCVWLI